MTGAYVMQQAKEDMSFSRYFAEDQAADKNEGSMVPWSTMFI